jgi:hypothetical protein
MGSSTRRKERRYLLGATPKATRLWWIGQVTVRVMTVCDSKLSTRHVREKAQYGAERSCRDRRRKRGLRRGKSRSRGRQPRRSSPPRQPLPKPLSSRLVNHRGRKFVWAKKKCNELATEARRMLSMKSRMFYSAAHGRETSRKALFKAHLQVKWASLADRARLLDIPYQAAFHSTWESFVDIEAKDSDFGVFDFILAGLPSREQARRSVTSSPPGNKPGGTSRRTDEVGNSTAVDPVVVCRHCQGLGATPGPGYPHGCRFCSKRRGGRKNTRGSSR